jgi:hypothetical protein
MPSREESAGGVGSPSRRPVRSGSSSPQAQALALQRLAGNRATANQLARWAAHPDPEKKGVIVPDVVAADFLRFNPPKNG